MNKLKELTADIEISEITRPVEHFAVSSRLIKNGESLRLDASNFNAGVAQAIEILSHCEMELKTLGEITERVFIPGRFKRIYVQQEHGLPFLQGSHIVHFQPADIKYVSKSAHKNIDTWIIKKGWLLVTRSGTVGRVAMCEKDWDGWAASEHILRIVPDEEKCSAGYLFAFLSSPIGQAQLTSKIYGAVVDELTEEQTRSVLVPIPKTKKQKEEAAEIDYEAHQAMKKRLEAIKLVNSSLGKMDEILGISQGMHRERNLKINASMEEAISASFKKGNPPKK